MRCQRLFFVMALLLEGCGRGRTVSEVENWGSNNAPKQLSELGLYEGRLSEVRPAQEWIPYRVNSTAFFDYAEGPRYLKLPAGTAIQFRPSGSFVFPVGTIIAQTLGYPVPGETKPQQRWVETRVLALTSTGWVVAPYIWNEEQTAAQLSVTGDQIRLRRVDRDGAVVDHLHLAPNSNGCKRCHKVAEETSPLATTVEQLNAVAFPPFEGNQLDAWKQHGWLDGAPPASDLPRLVNWKDDEFATVNDRARAWLHVNCAHCHNPTGAARNSGLHLTSDVTRPSLYGVYKPPVAAGRGSGTYRYDIVPGHPDESILVYRIASIEGGVMMPEYGRSVPHLEGVALIREWIASMKDDSASTADLVGDVTELSAEQLDSWVASVEQNGDPMRGEQVIRRADLSCLQCHALGGRGGRVGPDLQTLPANTTVAHLVESVLLPNKVVNPTYRAVTLETDDGLVLTGVLVRETQDQLVLRDPVRGDSIVPRSQITAMGDAATLMPANVMARLSKQDFRDLVRFLQSQVGKTPASETSIGSGAN